MAIIVSTNGQTILSLEAEIAAQLQHKHKNSAGIYVHGILAQSIDC